MAAVTAPQRTAAGSAGPVGDSERFDLQLPDRIARIPIWVVIGAILLVVMAISAVLRSRYLGGQYWEDEGLSVGISRTPCSRFPECCATTGRRRCTTCCCTCG